MPPFLNPLQPESHGGQADDLRRHHDDDDGRALRADGRADPPLAARAGAPRGDGRRPLARASDAQAHAQAETRRAEAGLAAAQTAQAEAAEAASDARAEAERARLAEAEAAESRAREAATAAANAAAQRSVLDAVATALDALVAGRLDERIDARMPDGFQPLADDYNAAVAGLAAMLQDVVDHMGRMSERTGRIVGLAREQTGRDRERQERIGQRSRRG